ncbi:MAG: hypothetical protein AAGJ54_04325 [Planctomycetota bacterium]
MNDSLESIVSRRSFLRQGSCAAMGLAGLTSQVFSMRSMGAVLDGQQFNDYRALVCIFLFDGNDSGNTLIPWDGGDENYADYRAERTTLALDQSDLNPTSSRRRTPAGVDSRCIRRSPGFISCSSKVTSRCCRTSGRS